MRRNLAILGVLELAFLSISWLLFHEMFILGWLFLNFLLSVWVARPCREQTIERITHLRNEVGNSLKQP